MADESSDLVFKWSKENTGRLIKLRSKYDTLFTGQKNTANHGWRVVLEEMELTALVTPLQTKKTKKKWDNLKRKYKDCKYPGSGEGTENGKPTAATWPWFALMDEILGQRPLWKGQSRDKQHSGYHHISNPKADVVKRL
ncbi:hypothetical protein SKAU_G00136930 [Synaphobranchus kaupii]|uniref:Myb/SANT-like DNA-binding domain-containing protein n=1 Tax=Synaphobranchus kaupii TaxID=118154 RepID=A0A9Q1J1S3_SYNKA|nr:hypothetical protein SKAU_G00136930 [Synaphobranchus kaupii]